MIITISGDPGSGKTTLARQLAKVTGFEELNVGGIMRQAAAEAKMTLEEFYKNLAADSVREIQIDRLVIQRMAEGNNLIVQGRVAFYMARLSGFEAINIFLGVHPYQGAERLAKRPEHANQEMDVIRREALGRQNEERFRYRNLYGIKNHCDPKCFDIVIDTTALHADAVFEKVLAAIAVMMLRKLNSPEES